jgi:hypothetical protein
MFLACACAAALSAWLIRAPVQLLDVVLRTPAASKCSPHRPPNSPSYAALLAQVRDLYWTFRNFNQRVRDFLRYRRITGEKGAAGEATWHHGVRAPAAVPRLPLDPPGADLPSWAAKCRIQAGWLAVLATQA